MFCLLSLFEVVISKAIEQYVSITNASANVAKIIETIYNVPNFIFIKACFLLFSYGIGCSSLTKQPDNLQFDNLPFTVFLSSQAVFVLKLSAIHNSQCVIMLRPKS